MPPSLKAIDCYHKWKLRKNVLFTDVERKGARARSLTLPQAISFEVCVQCWSINPPINLPSVKVDDQAQRNDVVP